MKRVFKVVVIFSFLAVFMSFGTRIGAEEAVGEYVVGSVGGEYTLSAYINGESAPIMHSNDIRQIAERLDGISSEKRVHFSDVQVNESFALSGSYTLLGSLSLNEGAVLSFSDGDITAQGLKINITEGYIRLKSGRLCFSESELIAERGTPLRLDYSSGAKFVMESGTVETKEGAAIDLSLGSAEISAGVVKSADSHAIECTSTLVLSGRPEISGFMYDIVTTKPITLSNANTSFSGRVDVKYRCSFGLGKISTVFYSASEESVGCISLYDENDSNVSIRYFESFSGVDERSFLAVYLPHVVSFYQGDVLVKRAEIVDGRNLEAPALPERDGYKFSGWTLDEDGAILYDFAQNVNKSFDLYSKYELLPPEFTLSSVSFSYDEHSHIFGLSSLSHPLLENASVSYRWFRDGVALNLFTEKIEVKNVSDSGEYSCELTFMYGNDIVSVRTPEVSVKVTRATVSTPQILPKAYTGELQMPSVYSTSKYVVRTEGGAYVGTYPVLLTLTDNENYVFENGEAEILLDFEIIKGENFWTSELSVFDIYENQTVAPKSKSRFGEVTYLYSDKSGEQYSQNLPTEAGEYFCIAYVPGTLNYTELKSDPVAFCVIEEKVVGISVKTPPEKTVYKAFECFSPTGLSLSVTYNSSRVETVGADRIKIEYQTKDSFRYGDSAVIVSYLNKSLFIPVSVAKLDYNITDIKFEDLTLVYDGEEKTVSYTGILPVGLDGIPLTASVIGYGKNVGEYTVALTFSTSSKNYNLPESIVSVLKILPAERNVIFSGTEFTYDGEQKCPKAHYIDVYGRKISLSVSGARSFAGEYVAVATGEDANYKLLDASVTYVIKKADYNLDGVKWTTGGFTYDGEEKNVALTGLPPSLSVIGYSDNRGTDAGKYTARAVLSYDEQNYNKPRDLSFEWEIKKADYDISGFNFSDTVAEYNGSEHYPTLSGNMPVGIDGSVLKYEFSKGVLHVSEGRCEVKITFTTESKNYNSPSEEVAYVEVVPKGVHVIWSDTEFTYDMFNHLPTAFVNECSVSVLGMQSEAGEYVATAISNNSDFYVINSTANFTIIRANNLWTSPLEIENVYEGNPPAPSAIAQGGEVEYLYYTSEGDLLDSAPQLPGEYYVVAFSEGNRNYKGIRSDKKSFSVIKVVPVSIHIEIKRDRFLAFETLGENDLSVTVKNNDGSEAEVPYEKLDIRYQNDGCFLFGMGCATVCYGGLSETLSVSVDKANYDMSGARWSEEEFNFDGKEKRVYLLGLPEGVSVGEYFGNTATNAGSYTAKAVLIYDSKNYNPPTVEDGEFVIKKQTVVLPMVEKLYYNGKNQAPRIESELYSADFTPGLNAGKYKAYLKLYDSENYRFESGGDAYVLEYEILPKEILISLSDVDKYILSDMPEPEYEIGAGLVSGDDLMLKFIYKDGVVNCVSENPNYKLKVEVGEIIKHNFVSDDTLFILFVIFLCLITVTLILVVAVLYKNEIRRCVATLRYKFSPIERDVINTEPLTESIETQGEIDFPTSVDVERADSLITDDLAKDLVRQENIEIETEGKKKRIINVDTLSRNFDEGEAVDVNKLKEKSLVPYDTAYIKVLARGIIDKPLVVYANDFSLSAIKMIALTGGEAVKVVSVRKKHRKNDENT